MAAKPMKSLIALIFTAKQVDYLKQNYHIYLLKNGRINMCAIIDTNLDYISEAFDYVVRNVKE